MKLNDIVLVTEKNDVGRLWLGVVSQIIDNEIEIKETDDVIVGLSI